MNIKITQEVTPEVIVGVILFFLHKREDDFRITKQCVLDRSRSFLKYFGSEGCKQKLQELSDLGKREKAEALGRRFFPALFRKIDKNKSITFVKSMETQL